MLVKMIWKKLGGRSERRTVKIALPQARRALEQRNAVLAIISLNLEENARLFKLRLSLS
jgi:hypothetical protein